MFDTRLYHPRHGRSVEKGALKYIILDLLNEKPSHGYEIMRAMETRFHGLYSPSAGSVYPTLNLLEDMGYVTASERDGKKVYTMTDDGRKYLSEESSHIDGIKGRMFGSCGAHCGEDFRATMREMREAGMLLRKNAREITPEQWQRIRESMNRTYREVVEIVGSE
ncbi:MAG: PadR family transcriptional regulator [Dehalococcoidia bacterium]|nr:PadR family transcriptional regulator [Dehalococcoidia bacterium]